MKINVNEFGSWIKDEIRYEILKDIDQTIEDFKLEVESEGYVFSPLMVITEHEIGMWVKDDIRYRIKSNRYQSFRAEKLEKQLAGYVFDKIDDDIRELFLAKQKKKQVIAKDRYEFENGGLTLPNGIYVRTDDHTRQSLLAAIIMIGSDPTFVFNNWKMTDGSFIDMDATTVMQIYGGLMEFVAECFAKESLLNTDIDNVTTMVELDNINW